MELDKLISEITSIVMEKLQRECSSKTRLLVLSEYENKSLEAALNDVAYLEYFSSIKQLKDYDGIICPEMCPSGLVNIATGTASGILQEAFLQAILSGLRLYQLRDGVKFHDYKDTMPSGLLSLYQERENTLRSYGVRFVTIQELKLELQECDKKVEKVCDSSLNSEAISTKRRLVTEKQVKELYDNGARELLLSKKDIITSLAEDFMHDNHMSIKRE